MFKSKSSNILIILYQMFCFTESNNIRNYGWFLW